MTDAYIQRLRNKIASMDEAAVDSYVAQALESNTTFDRLQADIDADEEPERWDGQS